MKINVSEPEKKDVLKEFRNSEKNGILLYLPEIEKFFSVCIGTGNNLDHEDRQAGYDSYLEINEYEYDGNGLTFDVVDGGMFLYKTTEENYDDDICDAVEDALQYHYNNVPEFVPIQLFNF